MYSISTASKIIFGAALLLCALPQLFSAQSTDQAFPTAITTNEISGTIPPRDIGDPRLTTYYFTFHGNRGDVFINIVTNNFNGAIDIFTADGLNPRTKVTIYADNPERETGRVVYQRRDERLILRIQGRTLNDEPATFRVKFAGSFAPITSGVSGPPGEMPDVSVSGEDGVRVNSAGSILPKEPGLGERTAERNSDAARIDRSGAVADEFKEPAVKEVPKAADEKVEPEEIAADDAKEKKAITEKPERAKPRVIITDDLKPTEEAAREVTVDLTKKAGDDVSAVVTIEREPEEVDSTPPPEGNKTGAEKEAKEDEKEEAAPANPLANIFLRVELKDGSRLEKRMSEVSSVNVIDGILTVVLSDGEVMRFSILDVQKMTIEK